MILTYSTGKLQRLCEDEREMKRRRSDIEKKLRLRINALRTSETIEELVKNDPLGKWHRLTEDRLGQWSGSVSPNERIIIQPMSNGVKIIGIEEEQHANEVQIVEITDYHN